MVMPGVLILLIINFLKVPGPTLGYRCQSVIEPFQQMRRPWFEHRIQRGNPISVGMLAGSMNVSLKASW